MLRFLLGVFLISTGAANANPFCERLWLTRNLIFDRAGQCFSTTLGQAHFDNADCHATPAPLDARNQWAVERILELEAEWDCDLDTSMPRLSHWDSRFSDLLELQVLPVPTEYESACDGYRGEVLSLHLAPSDSAPVVGRIEPGISISFSHWPEGEWDFVRLYSDQTGDLFEQGWARIDLGHVACDQYAG